METVYIQPGTFTMGSPASESGRYDDEGPQHEVTISKGFYLGKYEVTQGQWQAVMGTTPWSGQNYVQANAEHPAVYVSWTDAQAFIQKLNEAAGKTLYGLPTEAEWEYACRAGTTARWSFGDDESQLKDYAWYDVNAWDVGERYAHKVGTKQANPWGLYDMHGNVWEGCADRYGAYWGGCFDCYGNSTRSASRGDASPSGRDSDVGFRLLKQIAGQAGPSIRLSITSLAMDNTNVGATSQKAFTISNDGYADLSITSIRVSGTDATQFTVSPTSFMTNVGDSTTVTVTFSPTSGGAKTGAITISSNDPTAPTRTVALSGVGVEAKLALTPEEELLFPRPVAVGSRDTASVWVHNRGTGMLEVEEIAISPDVFEVFPKSLSVAQGDSSLVQVVFTPEESADVIGEIRLRSNDPGAPERTLPVKASGRALPILTLSPEGEPTFPDTIGVGDMEVRTFEARNRGQGPLAVRGIASDSPAFVVLDTAFVVEPGGRQGVRVRFAPVQAGQAQGELSLYSDDPKAPTAVLRVSGIGARWPVLRVEPDSVDFGPVGVGMSGTVQMTLLNLGEVDLRVETQEGLLIQDEPPFSLEAPRFPLVIPKGFPRRLALTFRPFSVGVYTSAFLIRNNDPRRKDHRVALKGAGVVAGSSPQVVNLKISPLEGDFVTSLKPSPQPTRSPLGFRQCTASSTSPCCHFSSQRLSFHRF